MKKNCCSDGSDFFSLFSHIFLISPKSKNPPGNEGDAHFISHQHGDHSDPWVVQTFIDQGKPVVAPPDLWTEEPIFKSITHLERNTNTLHTLKIQ